eukprot:TRINITY_DN2448_c2_g1_i6.p1 TRINITY_DN2448_c2_g1~~TRINITY_DN2448_c2_g1_i6.p1  ORF type:complete len:119 (-),score=21.23 TRINITY_DN2448_c2_g1_i6:20-376(-)
MSKQAFGDLLGDAARNNDLAQVLHLLSTHPQNINMPNSRGQTALYCAAQQGHAGVIVELLCTQGVDVNFQVPDHLGTPLHTSGYNGHGEAVALLLVAGADLHLKNKIGLTAHQEAKGL